MDMLNTKRMAVDNVRRARRPETYTGRQPQNTRTMRYMTQPIHGTIARNNNAN
jgi:hypothetical protein